MTPTFTGSDLTTPMSVRLMHPTSYWSFKTELLIPLPENRFVFSPSLPTLEDDIPTHPAAQFKNLGVSFLISTSTPLVSHMGYNSKFKVHSLPTISKCFPPRPSHLTEHLDSCSSGSLPPLLLLCRSSRPWQPETSSTKISQVTPLFKTLQVASHNVHKNENKPNSLLWSAKPCTDRPWLPLQTPLLQLSPLHAPTHTGLLPAQSPCTGFSWQHSSPPELHVICLLVIHISAQNSSPPGGRF